MRGEGARIIDAKGQEFMHRYHPLVRANSQFELRELIRYYNRLPTKFWARVFSQPIYRLPARIVRRVGKELARLT